MNILTKSIEHRAVELIVNPAVHKDIDSSAVNISLIIQELYAAIPYNKRISYGIVHTIKILSEFLHEKFAEQKIPVFQIAAQLFEHSSDFRSRGVALGIISYCGLTEYKRTLPYFEKAASSSEWDIREFAQMFFKKITKKYPDQIHPWLMRLVKSDDENIRRFVSETLRPVSENRWLYKNPEYSLTILRHLFQEHAAYPRTSVGNNLSDCAKKLPDLVYEIVDSLVQTGNKDSYWIAYRACRNLVKKDPVMVMKLLKVNEYTYKDRNYKINER